MSLIGRYQSRIRAARSAYEQQQRQETAKRDDAAITSEEVMQELRT
ncbi:hypothetical protein ACFLQN_00470 [Candidatus Aenigmatarchaeota archaeon]